MDRIKAYRDIIASDNHGSLLYGVEIASGIPDCIPQQIVDNALTLNIAFLIQLGVEEVHAQGIYDIIVPLCTGHED
jgi:hypothetical protein